MATAAKAPPKPGRTARPGPPSPGAAPAPRRAPPRPKAPPPSRFGRLGRHGVAVVLGVGVVVLSPFVHAFWGDLGVILLGIFVLGFLMGRWTAPFS